MEVMPGYRQTEVGPIPDDWDLQRVCELGSVVTGGTPKTEVQAYWHGEYPWVTPTDISELRDMWESERMISEAGLKSIRQLPANSILVTCIASIGKNAILRCGGACNQQINAVIPKKGHSPEFFYYLFESSKPYLLANAGMTATSIISKAAFEQLKFPVPPPSEQLAIAEALSNIDALLSGLDRLIAKKRDLKQAAMQQLLTGQIRLPGFFGDWEMKRLGDVVRQCFSGATPRRNRPEFYQGSIRWITSGELNYNLITDTIEKITAEAVAETNLSILPVGTFLMAITGLEAEGTRGACGIVGAPSATNQSCMAVFPTPELLTEYLFHYYVYRGKSLALKYCQGTKQQSYTAGLVKQLPISLPPSTFEQRAIATALSDMDAELTALEARRDKTRALKYGMMQELLTGRTRLV